MKSAVRQTGADGVRKQPVKLCALNTSTTAPAELFTTVPTTGQGSRWDVLVDTSGLTPFCSFVRNTTLLAAESFVSSGDTVERLSSSIV
ncbi:hypothetical protein V3C99_016651 [Haemonchus contortus]